jgi:TonB family protein
MSIRRAVALALFVGCLFRLGEVAFSQQASSDGRVILQKTTPKYPEMARKINLGGTVKVLATVAADGKVKKVEPIGGSPLFVQAATEAVSQWKFAPGSESKETVELHFTP